ncbi:MAG: ABC transporter ATP-binding protein [Planctomycetota bacterium]|nr:ABC transporter ATP-binding protein [Planctomycetota bacterium]
MIEFLDVHRMYKTIAGDVHALRGVSLSLAAGDFGFVIGPSGSGKSTILHLAGALDRASSGVVRINGEDLSKLDDRRLSRFRRDNIGFIFQSFNLISNLSALDNVLVPMLPAGISKADRDRAAEMLAAVGLENRLHHRPNQLSGGEQQRVAVARALFKKPTVVLADEPTGELDSVTGREVFSLLRKANKDSRWTFLVVTHDRTHISQGDKLFCIRDGRLVADAEQHAFS